MATTTSERVDKDSNLVLLSDLRAQKNSSLPVFRLPPEILANVFIHAACKYHKSYGNPKFCVPHWVNVSYVCRHWRNVALGCPTLWTYHFTISPRWTEELLARSKQASLKIRIDFDYRTEPWCSRLLENVLSHAGRIQELSLNVSSDIFPTELSLNAPRLQFLDIDFSFDAPEQTLMISNGDSLHLRTLSLAYCPLPWHSSFNLSGVTTLYLYHIPSPSQPNILEFLTTLNRMQAVTVLHIDDALPSARGFLTSRAFDVFPKVTLPRLARLTVRVPLSTAIALLSRVGIPLKTRVRLDIESEDDSSIDDYAQLPSLVADRFSQSGNLSSSSPTIRSLVIQFINYSMFTFCASERSDCDADLPTWCAPRDRKIPLWILVSMKHSIAISIRAQIVGDICCAIPSTHVETLHTVYPTSSPDFWRKTLGHLDGLRYIRLSCGNMPNLLSLLSLSEDALVDATSRDHGAGLVDAIFSAHDRTRGHTFVPAMEALELYCIRFFSSDDLSLLDALSTRRAFDLTMTRCVITRAVEEDE